MYWVKAAPSAGDRMNNHHYILKAGQRHRDEGIWCLQGVCELAIAARVAKVMHGVGSLLSCLVIIGANLAQEEEACGDCVLHIFHPYRLFGMMADAVRAAQEDHRGRNPLRHDHGIMAGPLTMMSGSCPVLWIAWTASAHRCGSIGTADWSICRLQLTVRPRR